MSVLFFKNNRDILTRKIDLYVSFGSKKRIYIGIFACSFFAYFSSLSRIQLTEITSAPVSGFLSVRGELAHFFFFFLISSRRSLAKDALAHDVVLLRARSRVPFHLEIIKTASADSSAV